MFLFSIFLKILYIALQFNILGLVRLLFFKECNAFIQQERFNQKCR